MRWALLAAVEWHCARFAPGQNLSSEKPAGDVRHLLDRVLLPLLLRIRVWRGLLLLGFVVWGMCLPRLPHLASPALLTKLVRRKN